MAIGGRFLDIQMVKGSMFREGGRKGHLVTAQGADNLIML